MKHSPKAFAVLLSVTLVAASFPLYSHTTKVVAQDVQTTQKMKDWYIIPEEADVREHVVRWQDYKFGMFIHWGVYSELGVIESWSLVPKPISWMYRGRKERNMTYNEYREFYQNIYKSFNPLQFDPSKWADAAAYAGMKYLVFTTKHHDGFCIFDTKATDYKITSPDCPYSRYVHNANIAQRVFEAFREKDIKPGAPAINTRITRHLSRLSLMSLSAVHGSLA